MNISIISGLAVLFTAIFALPGIGMLSVDAVRDMYRDGALLVDVRTAGEFENGSAPGAINIPVQQLLQRVEAKGWSKDMTLLLFCRSGNRSGIAERQLRAAGFENVHNVGTVRRATTITE